MNIQELHEHFLIQFLAKKNINVTFGFMPEPCEKIESHIKATDEKLYTLISGIRDRVTFNRRRYGIGSFYTWANSSEVLLSQDPWPASVYPKSVLFVDIAYAIEQGRFGSKFEAA
jgi:hypothetical protein